MARIEKFDISKYPNALNLVFNSRNNRRYMARWKLIRGEEYDALKTEIKGFYDREEEVNTYLEAVRKQLPKLGLPDMSRMTREDIRRAYEQNAPVMGVVNYIAENVGEVMRYFELYDSKGNQIEKHPVLDALRRPNDRFSLKKFALFFLRIQHEVLQVPVVNSKVFLYSNDLLLFSVQLLLFPFA